MNKVVSVEIARQMFWMDEAAFETLQRYLRTLRQQLAAHESVAEIIEDIELRIAELLYANSGDGRRAISAARLDEVIAQIGYIDEEERDAEIPRRTYRDPQNRMLGGVCAGLATRFGVHALVLRLIFLGLAALFGLGVVLYLILWIALDPSDNRNAALASQGKAQTAARIAAFEAPRAEPLRALQRIVFLPIRLLGTLIALVANHARRHRQGYAAIGRNLLALVVIAGDLFISVYVVKFTQSRLFPWPITTLLAASVIYFLIFGTVLFLRHVYLARPAFEIRRGLMIGALIPIAVLVVASIYINLAHVEHASTSIEKSFDLDGSHLTMDFASHPATGAFTRPAMFTIQTSDATPGKVTLHIEYVAAGANVGDAGRNIHAIDYAFAFANDNLRLDRSWSLRDDALKRGQGVHVTVVVPADILVDSSLPLRVDRSSQPLRYHAVADAAGPVTYRSRGRYLDETGPAFADRLSDNERTLLEQTFCESYFLSESWRCAANLHQPVRHNPRFDQVLLRDADAIEQLRKLLLQRRPIPVNALASFRELAGSVTSLDGARHAFRDYVHHLIDIKATPDDVPSQNSG